MSAGDRGGDLAYLCIVLPVMSAEVGIKFRHLPGDEYRHRR